MTSRPPCISLAHPLGVVLLLLPLACGSDDAMLDDGPSGSDGPVTTSTSGPEPTGTTISSTGSTTGSTTEPADDSGTTLASDMGGEGYCGIFPDDPQCPPGEKCMPWASNGDSTWNAWNCFPVVDMPAEVDEPCEVLGEPLAGLDTCEAGAMCWNVDPETLAGTCFPFCTGSELEPTCDDPGRFCDISGDGTPYLCAEWCDPLALDCGVGLTCIPDNDWWSCAPDASGDMGAYGDPCEFLNGCDPGLACRPSSTVPPGLPCEGMTSCCTEICDLSDPLGDDQCAGVLEGQTCQPWYGVGGAPMGLENVGVCSLP